MKKNRYERFVEKRTRKIDTTDLWIVPYADFMSVLMILFLLLFAFAYTSRKEKNYTQIISSLQTEMGGKVSQSLKNELQERQKSEQTEAQLNDIIEKLKLSKYVTVHKDLERIKLTLNVPILFEVGKCELHGEFKSILHEIALILKGIDNDIVIEGHTDNIPLHGVGKMRSNWELSQGRALSVIRFFTNNEGIPSRRFAAAGYGEYHPIFPNDSDEHRSSNRRIEINILSNRTKV